MLCLGRYDVGAKIHNGTMLTLLAECKQTVSPGSSPFAFSPPINLRTVVKAVL